MILQVTLTHSQLTWAQSRELVDQHTPLQVKSRPKLVGLIVFTHGAKTTLIMTDLQVISNNKWQIIPHGNANRITNQIGELLINRMNGVQQAGAQPYLSITMMHCQQWQQRLLHGLQAQASHGRGCCVVCTPLYARRSKCNINFLYRPMHIMHAPNNGNHRCNQKPNASTRRQCNNGRKLCWLFLSLHYYRVSQKRRNIFRYLISKKSHFKIRHCVMPPPGAMIEVLHLCTTTFVLGPSVQAITNSSAMAERPRELDDFKKARVNGGTDNDSLKDSHKCIRCR